MKTNMDFVFQLFPFPSVLQVVKLYMFPGTEEN